MTGIVQLPASDFQNQKNKRCVCTEKKMVEANEAAMGVLKSV